MTEVCFNLSEGHFTAACRQQQQAVETGVSTQPQAQATEKVAPPRCAVQGSETFIPRGTPASDLASLFPR